MDDDDLFSRAVANIENGAIRLSVLHWMERNDWHLKHPRIHTFWEWVVMPKCWGGRLGFRNWLAYQLRND